MTQYHQHRRRKFRCFSSKSTVDLPKEWIKSTAEEESRARATLENTRKELDDCDSFTAMAKKGKS